MLFTMIEEWYDSGLGRGESAILAMTPSSTCSPVPTQGVSERITNRWAVLLYYGLVYRPTGALMAQLNIRIDDESRDLFDSLARARDLSTSDLLRELIWQALGRNDERPRDDTTPPSLSALERRQLAMQHEILAFLTAEDDWETAYHRQMVEVMNSGFTSEYYKTFQMIQPEMTARECNLVHDILEMFTTVERSVAELTNEERAPLGDRSHHALRFRGFDFNNSQEGRLASYAHHVIKDGRWTDMADRFDDKHESGNSHMPMLATYQRMLSVWKPLWDKKIKSYGGANNYRFTVDELQQILAAWPYPTS